MLRLLAASRVRFLAIINFILFTLFTSSVFAEPDHAVTTAELAGNIANSFVALKQLAMSLSFLIGLALVIISPIWLIAAIVTRYFFKKNASVIKPLIFLAVGAILLIIPGIF